MTFSTNPLLIRSAITAIHKTLRADIFALSATLATTDEDTVKILDAMRDIRHQILSQSQQEERLLEAPLRSYDPVLANQLEDNHLKLATQLDNLCAQARLLIPLPHNKRQQAQHNLYLDWNHFVSEYLQHLEVKERDMIPALMLSLSPEASLASATFIQMPNLLQAHASPATGECCHGKP